MGPRGSNSRPLDLQSDAHICRHVTDCATQPALLHCKAFYCRMQRVLIFLLVADTSHAISKFLTHSLILYVPVNNFSVMSRQVFLDWTCTKQQIKCFAQGHNTVTQPVVRLELANLRPQSKAQPTTALCPCFSNIICSLACIWHTSASIDVVNVQKEPINLWSGEAVCKSNVYITNWYKLITIIWGEWFLIYQ